MKRQYFNVLRVASALAVVFLHSNIGIWTFSQEPYWFKATFITMLTYWAVPCFTMMSGALLIDYSDRYSTKTFLLKRVKKTLLPYVAWCLIAIAYLIFCGGMDPNTLSIRSVTGMIASNTALSIYWYFTELFTVYLATPLLTFIPKDKRKKVFAYIIVSILILNIAVPFFASLCGLGNVAIKMPLATWCLYYVAGYYIDRYLDPKWFKAFYMLSIGGFLTMLFGTVYASLKAGELNQTYMGGTNLPCVCLSLGIFCAFKQIFDLHVCNEAGRQAGRQATLLSGSLVSLSTKRLASTWYTGMCLTNSVTFLVLPILTLYLGFL